MKTLVVVEGQTDKLVLARVLEAICPKVDVAFYVGEGWSGAEALARTLLTTTTFPVVLVIDADSVRPDKVEQRRRFLHASLSEVAPQGRWIVVLMVPELERAFFEDERLVNDIARRKLSAEERIRAKFEPRAVLTEICGGQPEFRRRIDGLDLSPLADASNVRDLFDFVRGEEFAKTGS